MPRTRLAAGAVATCVGAVEVQQGGVFRRLAKGGLPDAVANASLATADRPDVLRIEPRGCPQGANARCRGVPDPKGHSEAGLARVTLSAFRDRKCDAFPIGAPNIRTGNKYYGLGLPKRDRNPLK